MLISLCFTCINRIGEESGVFLRLPTDAHKLHLDLLKIGKFQNSLSLSQIRLILFSWGKERLSIILQSPNNKGCLNSSNRIVSYVQKTKKKLN